MTNVWVDYIISADTEILCGCKDGFSTTVAEHGGEDYITEAITVFHKNNRRTVHVSLAEVRNHAAQYHRGFLPIFIEILDHEYAHALGTFFRAEFKLGIDEETAYRFEAAGAWARR